MYNILRIFWGNPNYQESGRDMESPSSINLPGLKQDRYV